jgi:hypothetical protein
MLMPGAFAVAGLLLLALHLARPAILHRLIHADTQLLRRVGWLPDDLLLPDGPYERAYRVGAVGVLITWTVANVLIFAASYLPGF